MFCRAQNEISSCNTSLPGLWYSLTQKTIIDKVFSQLRWHTGPRQNTFFFLVETRDQDQYYVRNILRNFHCFIVSLLMLPYPFWGIFEFCFECYWHIITNNTKTQWCLESTGLENWLSNLLSVYCILSNKYQLLILHLLIYYVYVILVYNTIIMVL